MGEKESLHSTLRSMVAEKTLDLKEELGKPFPTQPLNPSVNTEFKYEAWKKYKARKDEVYLLRRQIVDRRLQRKNNVNTKEEDAEFVKFEQAEIAKNEKLGRRVSSRAIRNKFESMKKAKQDELRKIQILKHEERQKRKRKNKNALSLCKDNVHRKSNNFVENSENTKVDKSKIEKNCFSWIEILPHLNARLQNARHEKKKEKNSAKNTKKLNRRRSWHEISSQEEG